MFKKLPLALMMGTLLSASNAFALGVGDIKVNSALNQRLNAEIELFSSAEDELDNVTVELASVDAFERLKLDRPYHLTAIKFTVTTRADGTPIVRLSTDANIREPFLDFLIDIDWPKGHMIREYTVLLDPPVVMAAAPAKTVSQPMAEVPAAEEPVITPLEPIEPAISEPAGYIETGTFATGQTDELGFPIYSSTPGESQSGRVSYSGESYGPVAADETLWSIASQVRSGSASTQQMMLALFEANPDAFVNGDIHNVKRGAVLRIPDEAAQISRAQGDALAEVRQLNASIGIAPDATAETTREQPGLPDVSEPVMAAEPEVVDDSKLSLIEPDDASVTSAGTASTDAALKRELSLARERITSQGMENQELASRVKELESSIADMGKLKRLLELQNQEMAQLQKQLADAEGVAVPAEIEPMAEPEVAEEPVVAEAAPVDTGADADTGTDVITSSVEEEAVAEEPAPAEEVVEPLPPAVKKGPMDIVMDLVNTAKRDPMALIGKLKKDPTLMGIVGGVLLVLLALIVLVFRRGKGGTAEPVEKPVKEEKPAKEKKDKTGGLGGKIKGMLKKKPKAGAAEEEPEIDLSDMFPDEAETATQIHDTDEAPAAPQAEDATILEAPVDTGAAEAMAGMGFEEDTSGAAEALPEAAAAEEPAVPEGPDPLEEVDVYEAFGDFDQAAEIVKAVLADAPDNNDFKLRLFSVYNGGGMSDEFATAAVQYQAGMEGSPQWDEVVAMGKQIAPDCPAWGDSQSSPALPASDAGDMANTMAMDISDIQSLDAGIDEPTPPDATESLDEGMDFGFEEAPAGGDATVADVGAELDLGTDDQLADMTPASPSAPLEESNELEFDLGDMDFESAEEPAADSTENTEALDADNALDMGGLEFESADESIGDDTAVLPSMDEDNSLDFGMDETAVIEEPADAPAVTTDDNELEFDLGDVSLDISGEAEALEMDDSVSEGLDMVSETVQVNLSADELEASASEGLSEDPTVMPEIEEPVAAGQEPESSLGVDLSDFSFDMDDSSNQDALISADDSDLEMELGDSEGGLELDMGGGTDDLGMDELSLDMGDSELSLDMGDSSEGSEDPTMLLAEDSGDSDSLSAEGNEVSTKLDLARAYIDMGDAEGAKGILEEVVAEGNDEQKAEAEQLLQQAG